MTTRLLYGGFRLVVLQLAAFCTVSFASDLSEPITPALSAPHQQFLSRLARRTMEDAVLGRQLYEPAYVPGALETLEAEVVVRLRRSGYLLGEGAGGPRPVALSARDATAAAVQVWMSAGSAETALLSELLVEIEVVGPAEPIDAQVDWTQPRAVDPFVEPGVHGMVILAPQVQRRFCPTEIFTNDLVVADALKSLAPNMLSDPGQVAKAQLMRFRTVHWYQPQSGADIVSLHRGLTIVAPEQVSAKGLDHAISTLAEYMAHRQLASGLFTYQYSPALNRYSDDNNLVRQVGTVAAMAIHARWSGTSASRAAADLGIRYHLQGLTPIPGVKGASFIATADGRNKLGVTALLALAMAEHPDPARYAGPRRELINGMLWLQQRSGGFITAFPPAQKLSTQDYFPGEALLALAAHYSLEPDGRILDAFDRAIGYYRDYFRTRPSPAFVPWQVQAYALIARHGKRPDYIEYVFELTDWLADRQLDVTNNPWPELWGGIAAYQPGRAGVATAAYLEGFADALAVARMVGDVERISRYERVVRDAARFVMQLQVRPEEAYFIRSPQDAVGGIRTTPSLNLLRIDHCQHALIGLIKARRVLFPSSD